MTDLDTQIVQLVQRARSDPTLELEARVGVFGNDHTFTSGFSPEHRAVITRLLGRLTHMSASQSKYWEARKQYLFARAYYSNGIRQTSTSNESATYCRKTRLVCVDMLTDRPPDLRVALSREVDLALENMTDAERNVVTKERPNPVRMVQRATFVERLDMSHLPPDQRQLENVRFIYDVSKVSQDGKNKMQCTEKPCTYHVEVELDLRQLPPTNEEHCAEQNAYIAQCFLNRMKSVLGTHIRVQCADGEWRDSPLPPPKLQLLHAQ